MIVTYQSQDGFSAATAAGILFFNVGRTEAERQLVNAGIDPEALDSPADPLVWRSTLTSAFAHSLQALDNSIETLPQSSDVEEVRERQDVLHDQLNDLRRAVQISDIRTEIARCERILWQEELPQLMQATRASEYQCVMLLKRMSPTAKRIEALHAEWRALL